MTNYHSRADLATLDEFDWWLRPVAEPAVADDGLVEALVGSISRAARGAGPAVRRALLHATNAVARLARNVNEKGWVQVSSRYVEEGVACSRGTAREALRLLASALLCKRTERGFLTVVPEARAACLRAVDRLGAPRPEVHRDDWTGDVVEIETPRERGKARCPCGHHRNGDRSPSLAYDLRTGLATCQVSRAIYRRRDDESWVEVRKPFAVQEEARSLSEVDPNQYPEGSEVDGYPWSRRTGWGSLLTGTLRPGDLRRYEARRGRRSRSVEEVLVASERRYGGPSEEDKARTCALADSYRPERLVSLDRWILDYDRTTWRERQDGTWFPTHRVYRNVGTDLVAFDLDGLDARPTDLDEEAIERILAEFDDEVLSPVSIVATSETGLQVLARTPGWCPDSSRLYLDLRVQRMLRRIGDRLVEVLGRRGEVDRSSWAPGRYVRRPGWRVKAGRAVRARLWWTTPAESPE